MAQYTQEYGLESIRKIAPSTLTENKTSLPQ